MFESPKEIAEKARAAFARAKMTPEEHFAHLIQLGWINRLGEVTTALGGTAKPELWSNVCQNDDKPKRKAKKSRRK